MRALVVDAAARHTLETEATDVHVLLPTMQADGRVRATEVRAAVA